MRKLGEPDARGAEAALAILGEAVTSANSVLGALDENAAQGGIVLTRAQLHEWAGLGRDLTGPETARLARCIPGSSIPEAIGVIVRDAMGLAAGDNARPGWGRPAAAPVAGPARRVSPRHRDGGSRMPAASPGETWLPFRCRTRPSRPPPVSVTHNRSGNICVLMCRAAHPAPARGRDPHDQAGQSQPKGLASS